MGPYLAEPKEKEEPPGSRPWVRRALGGTCAAVFFLGAVAVLPRPGSRQQKVAVEPSPPVVAESVPAPSPHPSGSVAPPGGHRSASPPGRAAPAASRSSATPAAGPSAPTPGRAAAPAAPVPVSITVPAPSPCSLGACVDVDGTSPIGPVDRVGSGLNDGVAAGANQDVPAMTNLDVRLYRGAPTVGLLNSYDWNDWDAAAASGAKMDLILSNMWEQRNLDGTRATPWSNWSAYANWVRTTVKNVIASGRRVDYWDIYNEPGWNDYYPYSEFQSETPQELLTQFLVAYNAIRSVDPRAAVVGPSIGKWSLTPVKPDNTTHEFDLGTFLRFAAANHLRLAAVAWHDNSQNPTQLYGEAVATQNLIHSLPALGDPPMWIDEYADRKTQPMPGWDVGYLAALNRAGVPVAARSCWQTCTSPLMDGLLANGGWSYTSEYFARLTYARMSGSMVVARSSSPTVSAIAAEDPASGTMVGLLGRWASCGLAAWCRSEWGGGAQPAPPLPVHVHLTLPRTDGPPNVVVTYDPFQPGTTVSAALPYRPADLTIGPGAAGTEVVDFDIPAFPDGGAYGFVVSSGSPGTA